MEVGDNMYGVLARAVRTGGLVQRWLKFLLPGKAGGARVGELMCQVSREKGARPVSSAGKASRSEGAAALHQHCLWRRTI